MALALGIDAGGTRTRWALGDASGHVLAEGEVTGLSALQMGSSDGRANVLEQFRAIARDVLAHGRPQAIRAGLTGFAGDGAQMTEWLAGLFALPAGRIAFCGDIEIAYFDHFNAGEGYLVYAGTGSIGAFYDGDRVFHRAGGRGVMLDDGGGGFWIAREAVRHIWRREDERPGIWRESPMAQAIFERMGGSDWATSREFVYGRERGEVGQLALAVAATADIDPVAGAILLDAGAELARLGNALAARFGDRPVVLAGRAAQLHPMIFESMGYSMPAGVQLRQSVGQAHHAAARIAAKSLD